MNKTETDSDLV